MTSTLDLPPMTGSANDATRGKRSPYMPPPPPPPAEDMSRQYCRYTATKSDDVCDRCCKIAARGEDTAEDQVKGLLVVFNPYDLWHLAFGNGFRMKRETFVGDREQYGPPPPPPPTPPSDPSADRFVQCMCCAPKDFYY
ncbi:hypothetical protein AB6A40_009372 [Gnathostoma spinigerum]|uniref:Uncharacterized protein n=1 Tax=Gnathostoma spinigerum TaxID=75299 RepID=A0ABD6EZR5_9BILA